jgi:hypothetical protein
MRRRAEHAYGGSRLPLALMAGEGIGENTVCAGTSRMTNSTLTQSMARVFDVHWNRLKRIPAISINPRSLPMLTIEQVREIKAGCKGDAPNKWSVVVP